MRTHDKVSSTTSESKTKVSRLALANEAVRKKTISNIKENFPELADMLSNATNANGKKLFNKKEVYNILQNTKDVKNAPDKIAATLSNPEEKER